MGELDEKGIIKEIYERNSWSLQSQKFKCVPRRTKVRKKHRMTELDGKCNQAKKKRWTHEVKNRRVPRSKNKEEKKKKSSIICLERVHKKT